MMFKARSINPKIKIVFLKVELYLLEVGGAPPITWLSCDGGTRPTISPLGCMAYQCLSAS